MVVPGPGGVQGHSNPVDTQIDTQVDIPEAGTGTRRGTLNTDAAAYFCLIVFINMKELLIFSFYQLNRIYSDFI